MLEIMTRSHAPLQQPSPDARRRWWMLLLGIVAYGTFYTGRQNFGIAAAALRSELHLTALQVGTASGCMLLAYALGSLLSGYLADRFDARAIVCSGALLSVALNWQVSFAKGYAWVLLAWTLNGAAQALAWAPCSRMVTSWWPAEKRGSVFGVILFAAGLASLVTYALSLLSLQHFGWRGVFRLPSLSMLLTVVLFFLFAQHGPQPGHHLQAVSADKGAGPRSAPLLRSPRFLLLCASIGCESLARYGLLIWVPIHILGRDWRTSAAGRWLLLFLPLGMALGALSTGLLSDVLFRRHRVLAIVALMSAGSLLVGTFFFLPATSFALSCALLLAAGFAVYGPQAAYWTVACESAGPSRHGAALGTMDCAAYLFAACGEAVIGSVVDRTGTTRSIFPTIASACVLAALMAIPSLRRKGVQA